ncbi:DNA polymerase III subunit beta [Actinomadura kijaniata]|uniref:DNA polymerase-3 subunit beta n=1 Tax=Actinomadura namibiensis TaxID=182080 RepID=A0A7W3LTJ4_ACTNM|nr:DNA polymerase III subunit beta [Actinomadura namibiensis]MBA8953942.1 DNA polymerase-3 subunit beta [Actinomadura namibiensis]
MKFTADAATFAEAVAWTARFLSTRPFAPVLAGIRLHADAAADQVTLAAFDYEVAAQATVNAEAGTRVATSGTVLVPGRLLADIAQHLSGHSSSAEVIAEGAKVILRAGRAEFTLLTMPLEDYPTLPQMPPVIGQIDAAFFARAIAQTAVAAAHTNTVPMHCAIRIDVRLDQPLRLFATDSYRLAVRTLPTWQPTLPTPGTSADAEEDQVQQPDGQEDNGSMSVFVHRPTMLTIAKTMACPSALSVGLQLDDNGSPHTLGVQLPDRTVVTRLVEGRVFAIDRFLTDERPLAVEVNTAALTAAVRGVAVVAERNTPVRLTVTASADRTNGADGTGGEVTLQSGNGEEAAGRDVLPVRCTGIAPGQEATIAFNPTFLLEALTSLGPGVCRLAFTTDYAKGRPALLTDTSTDPDGPIYWHFLMPVRLSG